MIWALSTIGLGRLKSAFAWLAGSTDRLLIAALCMALLWGFIGHRSADKWRGQASKATNTLTRERAEAIEAKAKAEADLRSKAHAADVSFQAGREDGDRRLAAYIAAHRMRPAQADPARPAQDRGAGLPANPAPEAIVAVSEPDLHTCDALYDYSRAAHEWAQSLKGN